MLFLLGFLFIDVGGCGGFIVLCILEIFFILMFLLCRLVFCIVGIDGRVEFLIFMFFILGCGLGSCCLVILFVFLIVGFVGVLGMVFGIFLFCI